MWSIGVLAFRKSLKEKRLANQEVFVFPERFICLNGWATVLSFPLVKSKCQFMQIKSFSDNVMTPKFASHYTFSISLQARMSHWKSNSFWLRSHSSKIHFCSVMKHSDNCIISKVSQLSLSEQNCNVMVVNFSQIIKMTGNSDMGWSENKTQFLFGFGRRREHMKKGTSKFWITYMDEWELGGWTGIGNVQNAKQNYMLTLSIITICSNIDCLW